MSVVVNTLKACFPRLSISMPALEILLVEDNHQEAFLIRKTLNQIGNVYWEENEQNGHLAVSEARFDMILLSLNLKRECTLDCFHRFYEQRPDIPIVILNDNNTKMLAEAALQQGALGNLDKGMIDNSEYLIKMITAFMIKAKFIKKAEEISSLAAKEKKGILDFWDKNKPINHKR